MGSLEVIFRGKGLHTKSIGLSNNMMGNCCFKKSIILQDKNQDEDMWNNLPPEVWMQIFEQFSRLKDIQNCYFTCQKWQSIIKTMFKDKGKIIIGFGVSPAGGIDLNVLYDAEGARRKSV